MQAMILAAGMGRRLGEFTQNNTKCMVPVNGETLICRLLNQLKSHPCISKVVIVVGYKGDILKEYIDSLHISLPIEYVENPDYERTNNIYSLYLAKDFLCQDDTLLFESDLIFEDSVLDLLLDDDRDTLALVDKFQSWMDGTCVELSENYKIKRFVARSKFDFKLIDRYYKTVNIYKFSKDFSRIQLVSVAQHTILLRTLKHYCASADLPPKDFRLKPLAKSSTKTTETSTPLLPARRFRAQRAHAFILPLPRASSSPLILPLQK